MGMHYLDPMGLKAHPRDETNLPWSAGTGERDMTGCTVTQGKQNVTG
jgi:hypothetical protein